MNKTEYIGKLNALYVGEKNCLEELITAYDEKDKEIERLNNIKKKAINELFNLKDMIYKPKTREINFDIQNKISSIIKILGSDEISK